MQRHSPKSGFNGAYMEEDEAGFWYYKPTVDMVLKARDEAYACLERKLSTERQALRADIAARILAGHIANSRLHPDALPSKEICESRAKLAVMAADALIKELEK